MKQLPHYPDEWPPRALMQALLLQAVSLIQAPRWEAIQDELGITGPQRVVLGELAFVHGGGPVPIFELRQSPRLASGSSYFTRLFGDMLTFGWIERHRATDGDRRLTYVSLTEDGWTLMEQVWERYLAMVEELTADLSDKEVTTLNGLLRRLR